MFNPSWLRGDSDTNQQDNVSEEGTTKDNKSTPQGEAMTQQASPSYPPQIQYIMTPNGPIPIQALGYPGYPPWMASPQLNSFQYPYLNYYHGQPGNQSTYGGASQQAYTIDANTGQMKHITPAATVQQSNRHQTSDDHDRNKGKHQNVRKPQKQSSEQNAKNQKPQKRKESVEVVEEKVSLAGLLNPSFNTEDEIRKWKEARKRNWPSKENLLRKQEEFTKNGELGKISESELSKLEVSLRKKLMFIDYDPYEEKRLNKAKRTLLHKVNSAKRYRTGVQKVRGEETGEVEDREESKDPNKKFEHPENRERSRYQKKDSRVRPNYKGAIKPILKTHSPTPADPNGKSISDSENEAPAEISAKQPNIQPQPKRVAFAIPEDIEPQDDTEQPEASKFTDNPKRPSKSHSAQDIIQHLKSRKKEDSQVVTNFLSDKPVADKFRYQQNSLLANLLLEDIFKERNIMLQSLRYLVKNKFLQPDDDSAETDPK